MPPPAEANALVLGLGNVLCGDDGLGVIALERLRRDFELPDGVSLVDGGTLGLALLPLLEDADVVWVLDAIAADAPPGTLVTLTGEAVEPALRERLSPHQIGVADLMDALHWRDTWPSSVRVLGLVPENLDLRIGLSRPLARGLDGLVAAVVRELSEAGLPPLPRAPDPHGSLAHDDDNRIARALGL
jgi:hydrogenase maturation protease